MTSPHKNLLLLNAIRDNASLEYRNRIPAATKGNITEVAKTIQRYKPMMNEFMDQLVGVVGEQLVRSWSWNNPLARFKRASMRYGATLEEIQTGLVKAKRFKSNNEISTDEIFGKDGLDYKTLYHTLNRQDMYKVTVTEAELNTAFHSEYGLNNLLSQQLETPYTSDNHDEFTAMMRLFREVRDNNTVKQIPLPKLDDTATPENARKALRKIRELAEEFRFINAEYNPASMPVAVRPEELVLFCTPSFKSAIDVEALAAAFNVEYADIGNSIITIPERYFDMPGVQAILTSESFFVVVDTLIEMRKAENPVGLYSNYFLHHWQIVSASTFAPLVLFTGGNQTAEGDTPITSLTGAEVHAINGGGKQSTVRRGALYELKATAAPINATEPVLWTVTGNSDPATRAVEGNLLYVGLAETVGAQLDVRASAAYQADKVSAAKVTVTA